MLQLCGADWEPRFVDFFNGEQRTPEFRRLDEMGEVPVLEHGDPGSPSRGDSRLSRREPRRLRVGERGRAARDLRWLLWDNHKLTSYVATLRFLIRFMKTGETPVTEFLRGRVKSALAVLNGHLEGRRFAVAERPTIADPPCAATCTGRTSSA